MGIFCCRITLVVVATIFLTGCVGGTVSTAFYNNPPETASFFVISPDPLSLTDRNISILIETELSKRGFMKAASIDAANIGALFSHSIDPTGSLVSDGVNVSTAYPRRFRIALIDLQKSKIPDKIEMFWQGELYSSGSSRNMSRLAPIFIEQLFLDYGKTVLNRGFRQ